MNADAGTRGVPLARLHRLMARLRSERGRLAKCLHLTCGEEGLKITLRICLTLLAVDEIVAAMADAADDASALAEARRLQDEMLQLLAPVLDVAVDVLPGAKALVEQSLCEGQAPRRKFCDEFDRAFLSLDEEAIRSFAREWDLGHCLPGDALSFWTCVHQVRAVTKSLPGDARVLSKNWLLARDAGASADELVEVAQLLLHDDEVA